MDKEVTGQQYEHLCAKFLKQKGFSNVTVTKGSGDQGVDITAYKNDIKYAVQCKYYSYPVPNTAVQQVVAGMNFYDCSKAIVITNNKFTQSAKDLAKANGVELWPNVKVASSEKTSKQQGSQRKKVNKKIVGLIILLCALVVVIFILVRSPIIRGRSESAETVVDSYNMEYILPDSDTRYYTETELSSLSKDELRLARNEIYARHGRKFDSEDLREYFGNQSWYEGTIDPSDFTEDLLNEYERANVDTIMAVEESKS